MHNRLSPVPSFLKVLDNGMKKILFGQGDSVKE